MAFHVASRLALIASATMALRGVLSGSSFESTVLPALLAGAGAYATGLIIGELTRRLIEDIVQADVRRILAASSDSPDNESGPIPAVQSARRT